MKSLVKPDPDKKRSVILGKGVCECIRPDIMIIQNIVCRKCGGKVDKSYTGLKFDDSCSFQNGITDFGGRFKIWECKHNVYCPLCGWRCKDVETLDKHLEMIVDGKRICSGLFFYGNYAIEQVQNEIKYWRVKHGRK